MSPGEHIRDNYRRQGAEAKEQEIIAMLEAKRKEYQDLGIQIGVAALSDAINAIKGESK